MADLVKRLRHDADMADRTYPEVFHVTTDLAREAADRIEALEKEALEWEARACAMFPYVPDDTKCGTLAKARDEAKARLERAEALEKTMRWIANFSTITAEGQAERIVVMIVTKARETLATKSASAEAEHDER